jgi:3-deoxy-D-manno-octulosonate 8-phosphate phosphatase (KDO 8-P phosphatase)
MTNSPPISIPHWLDPALHATLKRHVTLLKAVQCVVLDVDGVLTNGDIIYTEAGHELKTFNAKDGQGLALLAQIGIKTGIVTARQSVMVARRATELGMTFCCQHAKPKWPVLQTQLAQLQVPPSQVAYMGDDWPDVLPLQHVGFATCPVDAVPVVKAQCQWVSTQPGGGGAVRQLCDLVLAAHGYNPLV